MAGHLSFNASERNHETIKFTNDGHVGRTTKDEYHHVFDSCLLDSVMVVLKLIGTVYVMKISD